MINKIYIENYKIFKNFTLEFNKGLNIIVGDNEAGKSTILEAINLALTRRLNGKFIEYELTPHIFNQKTEKNYIANIKSNVAYPLPRILIEIYLEGGPIFSKLKGTNNFYNEDVPGIKLEITFNEDFRDEYQDLITNNTGSVNLIPAEYYKIQWFSFAHSAITSKSIPIKIGYTDASTIRLQSGADYYLQDIIKNNLEVKERVGLNISYRNLKESFCGQAPIRTLNEKLKTKKGTISNKDLSIALDISGRSSWETHLIPHLDELPFQLSGKGEQNVLKIMLSLEKKADESDIILIEEPENHLSFASMNKLIRQISDKCANKQIIIATHSTYVLNKLGLKNLILLNKETSSSLCSLTDETQDYFQKLSGYDTLRLVTTESSILVEGPSDELIVQKAYLQKYHKLPIEDGADVINVRGLSFMRFLEIAKNLNKKVTVITDNDGNFQNLDNKYAEYQTSEKIKISYSKDNSLRTLEYHLLSVNGREALNVIFNKSFQTDDEILNYMLSNKTECALAIFKITGNINFPYYIQDAI